MTLDAPPAKPSVMMICPNLKCRKVLQVPGKLRGQHVRCHYCGMTFCVPLAKENPAANGKPAADSPPPQNK